MASFTSVMVAIVSHVHRRPHTDDGDVTGPSLHPRRWRTANRKRGCTPQQQSAKPAHNATQHTHSNTHYTIKHRLIPAARRCWQIQVLISPILELLVTSLYVESHLRSSGTEFGSISSKSSSLSLPGRCVLSHQVVTSITHRVVFCLALHPS